MIWKCSKEQLEELYCCRIFEVKQKDGSSYFEANGVLVGDKKIFINTIGDTLEELHKNIRVEIYNNINF